MPLPTEGGALEAFSLARGTEDLVGELMRKMSGPRPKKTTGPNWAGLKFRDDPEVLAEVEEIRESLARLTEKSKAPAMSADAAGAGVKKKPPYSYFPAWVPQEPTRYFSYLQPPGTKSAYESAVSSVQAVQLRSTCPCQSVGSSLEADGSPSPRGNALLGPVKAEACAAACAAAGAAACAAYVRPPEYNQALAPPLRIRLLVEDPWAYKTALEDWIIRILDNPQRGDPELERRKGTVQWFSVGRGSGFLIDDQDHREHFVGRRSVKRVYLPQAEHSLYGGDWVEYTPLEGPSGTFAAGVTKLTRPITSASTPEVWQEDPECGGPCALQETQLGNLQFGPILHADPSSTFKDAQTPFIPTCSLTMSPHMNNSFNQIYCLPWKLPPGTPIPPMMPYSTRVVPDAGLSTSSATTAVYATATAGRSRVCAAVVPDPTTTCMTTRVRPSISSRKEGKESSEMVQNSGEQLY